MKIKIEHMIDAGCSGRKNQDAYWVGKKNVDNKEVVLGIVCDGVGGASDGEIASRIVVDVVSEDIWNDMSTYLKHGFSMDQISRQISVILNKMNYALYIESKKKGKRTGTTIALCLIVDQEYFIANVGDSRVYWHKGNGIYRTKDHTVAELKGNSLDPEDGHILWQSIGSQKKIKIDQYFGSVEIPMEILLLTDGGYRPFSRKEIIDYCKNGNLKKMKREALKRKEPDNLTGIRIAIL